MDHRLAGRRSRHSLDRQELAERLAELRRRQQAQVELDLRLLRHR
ncbi:hypothetical protein [Nocardioides sp.]|nr:hypothetical protein [Nocardioides sp.]